MLLKSVGQIECIKIIQVINQEVLEEVVLVDQLEVFRDQIGLDEAEALGKDGEYKLMSQNLSINPHIKLSKL